MASSADYIIGGAQGIASAGQESLKYRKQQDEENAPLTGGQQWLVDLMAGRMSGRDAAIMQKAHAAGLLGQGGASAAAPPPSVGAPSPAGQMGASVPQSLSQQVPPGAGAGVPPQGLAAQGAPGPVPGMAAAAPAQHVSTPSSGGYAPRSGPPMPQTQKELGQFMSTGAGLAAMQPKGLSVEDRVALLEKGEAVKQPGRIAVAQEQGKTRERVAVVGEEGKTKRTEVVEGGKKERFERAQGHKEKTDAEKNEIEKAKLKQAEKRDADKEAWMKGRLKQLDKAKEDGSPEEKKEMVKLIKEWRKNAAQLRRPDALGAQHEGNVKKADELDAKAEAYESRLIRKFGPGVLEAMPEYDEGGGLDDEATSTPGGMSVQPSPTERYLAPEGSAAPQDAAPTDSGGEHPIPTSIEVQEPETSIEYRRAPDGSIWQRDRSGRVTRVS